MTAGIPSDLLAWKQIISLFDEGKLRAKLKEMSQETLEFVAEEKNETVLVESLIKTLREVDPEKANIEYAAQVVEMMRNIALFILN